MARHRFKSSFGQCRCRWCGAWSRQGECPVTDEMRVALRTFAAANGKNWKHKLRWLWCTGGCSYEPALRQLRNVIGPTRLGNINQRMLETPKPPRRV